METLTTIKIVNISIISRSFLVSLDNPLFHLPHWSPTPTPQQSLICFLSIGS